MSVCTFFGHRDCYGLDTEKLWLALERLVTQGVDTFYVGNQGGFDRLVYGQLKQLRSKYPHIQIAVVLAYLPVEKGEEQWENTIFPEGLELCHPKFALERRNRWMVEAADYCVCYVNHSWGGAWKFVCFAQRSGLQIENLGSLPL